MLVAIGPMDLPLHTLGTLGAKKPPSHAPADETHEMQPKEHPMYTPID